MNRNLYNALALLSAGIFLCASDANAETVLDGFDLKTSDSQVTVMLHSERPVQYSVEDNTSGRALVLPNAQMSSQWLAKGSPVVLDENNRVIGQAVRYGSNGVKILLPAPGKRPLDLVVQQRFGPSDDSGTIRLRPRWVKPASAQTMQQLLAYASPSEQGQKAKQKQIATQRHTAVVSKPSVKADVRVKVQRRQHVVVKSTIKPLPKVNTVVAQATVAPKKLPVVQKVIETPKSVPAILPKARLESDNESLALLSADDSSVETETPVVDEPPLSAGSLVRVNPETSPLVPLIPSHDTVQQQKSVTVAAESPWTVVSDWSRWLWIGFGVLLALLGLGALLMVKPFIRYLNRLSSLPAQKPAQPSVAQPIVASPESSAVFGTESEAQPVDKPVIPADAYLWPTQSTSVKTLVEGTSPVRLLRSIKVPAASAGKRSGYTSRPGRNAS